MTKGIEKRKEKRIRVKLPIKISYGDIKITGETENISRLGAYVETTKEIPLGAGLEIGLSIPIYGKDSSLAGGIRCKGSVFRSSLTREEGPVKYYGLGIFFTDFLQQADRNKLSSYIDFLVLKEEEGAREGLNRWRQKRNVVKKPQSTEQGNTVECLSLLKQILSRLEELYRQAKLQNKAK
ncbi:MAG: PilZ domain-containing protein [Candidatus Omnitrophica bacterium]|nr:PilZ domain-containing protein [Candidatus Omnitrophota bacterium]